MTVPEKIHHVTIFRLNKSLSHVSPFREGIMWMNSYKKYVDLKTKSSSHSGFRDSSVMFIPPTLLAYLSNLFAPGPIYLEKDQKTSFLNLYVVHSFSSAFNWSIFEKSVVPPFRIVLFLRSYSYSFHHVFYFSQHVFYNT